MNNFFHITVIALTITFISIAPASAQNALDSIIHEIKGGVLVHDMDDMWSGFKRENGVDINAEAIFTPSLKILGGEIRPAAGVSINTSGDTSKIYLDARWEYSAANGLFFAFGLGGAVHDGKRHLVDNNMKALGSRLLFHIPIEAGYRIDAHHGISVYFDHISNGNTQDENEGLDTLGVRYGYRL